LFDAPDQSNLLITGTIGTTVTTQAIINIGSTSVTRTLQSTLKTTPGPGREISNKIQSDSLPYSRSLSIDNPVNASHTTRVTYSGANFSSMNLNLASLGDAFRFTSDAVPFYSLALIPTVEIILFSGIQLI
jgi:hypothetical protein